MPVHKETNEDIISITESDLSCVITEVINEIMKRKNKQ